MIEASNICKSFGSLDVLKGVDLEVKKGEVVAIIGKSGAGKSTLLHILGTLDSADSGRVVINGEDVSALSQKELAAFRNKNIGFIFQFHHLLPEFTAWENVCIPAYIHKTNPEKAKQKAIELLTYLGLADRVDHKPSQLSGGEQQRVAIARALINDPAVIFADEPTGNLDSVSSHDIHQLIFQLRDELNQTFIIVTHTEELAKMTDRIVVMKDGHIVESSGDNMKMDIQE